MSVETSYPTSVNWSTLKESRDVKENELNTLDQKVSQKLCSATTYDVLLKEGLFEEALQAAEGITVIYRRTNALVDICKALTQRGHIDKAMEIARKEYPAPSYNTICNELLAMGEIDRAIEFANINSSSYLSNEWAYKNICKALTNAGRLDQSLQLAQTHLSGYDLKEALSSLCQAKAKAGCVDEAFNIAGTIVDEQYKQDLLSAISKGLVESGNAVRSTEVACMIFDEIDRSLTFEHNAKELVKLGAIDQALEAANRISNDCAKRRALIPIQSALEKNGESAKAKEIESIIWSLPFPSEFGSLF